MMVTVTQLLTIKHINCVHDLHFKKKKVSQSVAVSIKDIASKGEIKRREVS